MESGNDVSTQKNAVKLQETADGTFITGLYLEAASYDAKQKMIVEAKPRELYSKMPIILFSPVREILQARSD